jgi:hypothetical protein
MTLRPLAAAAFLLGAFSLFGAEEKGGKGRAPSASPSPSLPPAQTLAPFEKRLAAAKLVKVMTSILDLELGSTLEQAHAQLDKLSDPATPPKEESEGAEKGEGSEHKVLWQLAKTDYSFVLVKADSKDRISYINGWLRPGKEIPFDKIGESKKAPVQDANAIAWDVLRSGQPLFRVFAQGADRKANTITIFIVKRPNRAGAD